MSFDATEIPVLGYHEIFVAAVGATFPTSVDDDPITSGWLQLGRTTEAGARFTFDRTVQQIFSSQFFDPARTIVTRLPKKVEYDLQQWNQNTLDFALGGIVWTTPAAGEVRGDPEDASFVDERALLIRAVDGDDIFMIGYARTINAKALSFAFVKTAEAALAIGSEVQGTAGESPYFIQSNALAAGS